MSNWKIDFEVKFSLQFKHINGRIEQKHNSLIVEAVNEEEAKKADAAAGLGLEASDFSDDGADLEELNDIIEGND